MVRAEPMDRPGILVVEDQPELARTLAYNLELDGYRATTAGTGEEALEKLTADAYQLVILDLLLPGIDGFEVCRRLRGSGSRVPVIMLTALDQTHQKIRGLDIGADDYLTKPFDLGELLARVKAILRRSPTGGPESGPVLRFGGVEVDLDAYEVRRGRRRDRLTHYEREILRLLVSHPGEVLSRSTFLDSVWGVDAFPTNRTVDNYILRLRRKIEKDPARPRHILTLHGVGYKFEP